MTKYSLHTDEIKEPSVEAIRRSKDFSTLKANYDVVKDMHKIPLYKNKKVFFGLLLVVLVVYLMMNKSDSEQSQKTTETEQIDSAQ